MRRVRTLSFPTRRSSGLRHRSADFDGAAIGRFLAGDKLEQRRLACAVGADHADDSARRKRKIELFEEQLVAERLGQSFRLDHLAAEELGFLDADLPLARRAVGTPFTQFVHGPVSGLSLGYPSFW